MSTSVTRGGTGLGSGRGRFVGVLAAGLALLIALGVVYMVNQGNEVASVGVGPVAGHPAVNIERTKMDLAGQLAVHPATNIERTKMDLAGQLATVTSPGANPEAYKMGLVGVRTPQEISAERHQTRVEMLDQAWLAQQAIWDQRYQDMVDRFENQSNSEVLEQRLIHDRLEDQR